MKFIYSLNPEVSLSLVQKGLKKIGETIINGTKADIFENNKEVYLGKYEKNTLILMNRLFF
jgi:hypothetical protein